MSQPSESDPIIAIPRPHGSVDNPGFIRVARGVTVLVGPNGAGKTRALRSLQSSLQPLVTPLNSYVRFLAAGRSAPLERFRSAWASPGHPDANSAHVGHAQYRPLWHQIESVTGDFLELEQRADLRLKVQARLQTFLARSIEFSWTQNGLEISVAPLNGGKAYSAAAEASGILQLVPLMAAIYNDRIGALLIDEPEISLHPQYQAFIRDELDAVAGDPRSEPGKKFVIIATHSPTMLGVRHARDLPNIVCFSSDKASLCQLDKDSSELNSKKLGSLIARLSATHRLAFFARNVLLVEGPSDEIILEQLAATLRHPLLPANAQIVPVNGKGEFVEAVRLFELLGKRVTVLADLDGLTDSNALTNHFGQRTEAKEAAEATGHANLAVFDRALRSDFARAVSESWDSIEVVASGHPYWSKCREDRRDDSAKRRAALAALLGGDVAELEARAPEAGFRSLLNRYNAFMDLIAKAGCFFLRRGAIESYFSTQFDAQSKPDAAALEAAEFPLTEHGQLEATYQEAIQALKHAGQISQIDENLMLRERLGAILGAAFQTVSVGTSDENLNARARSIIGDDATLFELKNISTEQQLAIRVTLRSPLFTRSTFPFDISATENANQILEARLPSPTSNWS